VIEYNFDTGKLICNANIKEVEQFIKGHMSKLDFMYKDKERALKTSSDPREEAKQANLVIARSAGIKNAEDFEKAINDMRISPWYVYSINNDKIFMNPYKEKQK
jgi:hypothetical protein